MNGPAGSPVFQIHPSLRCNLACAHCYSSSGPRRPTGLDPAVVKDAISDAAALGYRTISVSGGEPLLYAALPDVLGFAKSLGLRTTVTTNGTLLDARRLEPLGSVLDLLAISLDGDAVAHNRLRDNPSAHGRLMRGLDHLHDAELPFGFIHTLTKSSWEHVEAIVDFAREVDAGLVQLHPLELAGRAKTELRGEVCDEAVLAQVYILALALNVRYAGRPAIQYDVLHTESIAGSPGSFYADERCAGAQHPRAGDVGVLVLEADGTIVPMTFGFGRAYMVADLAHERLRDAWPRFARDGYPRFRDLCRAAHETVTSSGYPQFVNWYEMLHDRSLGGQELSL